MIFYTMGLMTGFCIGHFQEGDRWPFLFIAGLGYFGYGISLWRTK